MEILIWILILLPLIISLAVGIYHGYLNRPKVIRTNERVKVIYFLYRSAKITTVLAMLGALYNIRELENISIVVLVVYSVLYLFLHLGKQDVDLMSDQVGNDRISEMFF